MCGEKLPESTRRTALEGSPPRVRGEAFGAQDLRGAGWITPACAGRSNDLGLDAALDEDHPRVCGEKLTSFLNQSSPFGSPPRVRGEVVVACLTQADERITPACAGRRVSGENALDKIEDHPRVCGEKTKKIPNISRFYPGAACFSFSFS